MSSDPRSSSAEQPPSDPAAQAGGGPGAAGPPEASAGSSTPDASGTRADKKRIAGPPPATGRPTEAPGGPGPVASAEQLPAAAQAGRGAGTPAAAQIGGDAGAPAAAQIGGGAGAPADAPGRRMAAGTALAAPPRPVPGPPARPVHTAHPAAPPLHGPWPSDSLFGPRWPGPARPASPAAIAALVTAALVAALSIPLDRGGAGWLVTAVAGTAALVVARRAPHRMRTTVPRPALTFPVKHRSPDRYFWAAATVALLGVGTLRSAGWLFLLCLATAALTGALAVAGGRSARAMALAALMAPVAMFRAVPWVTNGLAALRRRGPGAGGGMRVVATVAVSVALLVVFGSLFASADAAFADVLTRFVPDVNVGTVTRWIFVFVVAGGLLGGAAYLRATPPDLSGLTGGRPGRVTRLEWAIPLGLLTLLFAMFVAIQLAVLFGGSSHVLDTDGLTYADYARGGFWQLLAVTGLTLVVLAGAVRWAPRATRADRVLIRVILGSLAGLTLVIVASALHRMDVYADTYGLTRLRVLVALCELWLGLTFVLVLVAGVRLRAAWLPRAVVGIGVLTLLGLAAANPDGLIAERNVARFAETDRIDLPYLSQLSADAVPALDRLDAIDPARRDCVLQELDRTLSTDPDDWRGWSHGRERARELLAADPPARAADCTIDHRG